MTQGVIWKQLAYFALPLFLGNLCQQLYNTADSVIVGKFVGKDALAADMLLCGGGVQQREPHLYDDGLFYGPVCGGRRHHQPLFRRQVL